jgi:hypothetical protein
MAVEVSVTDEVIVDVPNELIVEVEVSVVTVACCKPDS